MKKTEKPTKTTEKRFRAELSSRLKKAREDQGLTQRALAESAGIAEKYLSRIEMGIALPSVWVVYNLARALNLMIDDLAPRDRKLPEQRQALRSLNAAIARFEHTPPAAIDQAARVLEALLDPGS